MPGQSSPGLTIHRISALIDGIFAIAMTLLVLGISLPDKAIHFTHEKLHLFLLGQLDEILVYVLSFFLLANYWVVLHRQFNYLVKTDQTHLWIILCFLLFACLVPYTSSLTSDFSGDWLAQVYFSSNILILGLFTLLNWHYATKGKRLIDPKTPEEVIKGGRYRGQTAAVVACLALIIAFIKPGWSGYVYLLIPICYLNRKGFGQKHRKV